MRQVLRAGALGRPRGIRWRGRWEGGSGWGIHVNPWLIHVNVWQKPLQYCKVISLQLIKINGKEKSWLKARHSENEDHGNSSHHLMANRQGNSGNSDFILGGSKITADGDCSREIKRRLLLGRKVKTNLENIFKSRDITLPTKACLVKAMFFPVVMYRCESWEYKESLAPKD